MTPGRKTGKDRLSRAEIRKDALQETFTATTNAVGAVAGIVVGAVGDIGRAVGGYATELFEICESSRRAASDHEVDVVDVTEPEEPDDPDDPEDLGTQPAQ